MNKDLILTLKNALQSELPGNRAHQEMFSYSRPSADVIRDLDVNPRESAVMILLYREENTWFFPLIKRQAYDGVHSKQISLPGGQKDATDHDLEFTSLRETNEEIGAIKEDIEVLGHLSEIYIPPSNFLVKPFVGFLTQNNDFIRDEVEVNRIIKTPLQDLVESSIEKREKLVKDGSFKAEVSSFIIDDEVVWGATAMILNEFKILLKEKVL